MSLRTWGSDGCIDGKSENGETIWVRRELGSDFEPTELQRRVDSKAYVWSTRYLEIYNWNFGGKMGLAL